MIEKILERLETEKETANRTYETFKAKVDLGRTFGLEKAIEIVQEVAKEYGNGWIPCSERLPEPNTRVMACSNNGKIEIDAFGMVSQRWLRATKEKVEIVAWQPIPQPFKGVE